MMTQRRADVFVGGCLAVLGLLLLGGAWWTGYNRYAILKYWPAATAEVTKSEAYLALGPSGSSGRTYRAKIEFRFEVDGKQFTQSVSEKNGTLGGAQMTAHAYAPGTRHIIRYNPANPNDIRYNMDDTIFFFLTPILLGVFGLAVTRIGLLWVWRARSRQSRTAGKAG